jgi:hypothetical protein
MDHIAARKRPSSARFHKYLPYLVHQVGYQRFVMTFMLKYLVLYIDTSTSHPCLPICLSSRRQQSGPRNPSQQNLGKGGPNPPNKGKRKYGQYQDNQYKPQAKKDTRKTKKDTRKWCDFHKSPWHNTADCRSKQSLVSKVKASESDVRILTLRQNQKGEDESLTWNLVPLLLPPSSSLVNQTSQKKEIASSIHRCG